jgi:hypothetical protein
LRVSLVHCVWKECLYIEWAFAVEGIMNPKPTPTFHPSIDLEAQL